MQRWVYTERRKSLRSLLTVTAAITAVVMVLIWLDGFIRPTVESVCADECKRYASMLITRSIETTLSDNSQDYSGFAEIIYDENGRITAIETHAEKVNALQTTLLRNVNAALDKSRDTELHVSLGTASGVWIFAGRGPSVPLRFLPIGNATAKLISGLESAGINQTCHTITIKVTLSVAGAIPFCKTETVVEYEYLLSETLLVGDVPEGYAVLG